MGRVDSGAMRCTFDLDVSKGDAGVRYLSLRMPFLVPDPAMSCGVRLFRRV
jgi:hypothetical protein